MKSYPLESISLEKAIKNQFRLVELITENINGADFLNLGDLGVQKIHNKPIRTKAVEKILSQFFNSEDAILVRGAGTNAIRLSLYSLLKETNTILVHDAPIYKTTKVNLDAMKVNVLKYDFNTLENLETFLKENNIKVILLQHTRQKLDDKYDLEEVIKKIKKYDKNIKIIIDDNYAVLKTPKNGVEMGADVSCFSCFKLQGPEGIGLVIGKKEIIKDISQSNYSGGSQVQGFEAMKTLTGILNANVSLAIQAQEINKLHILLQDKKRFPYIKEAFIANAQSKVVLVEFKENFAKLLLEYTCKFGALSHPVGAESKYELPPLIYRVSGSFLDSDKTLIDRMIRINPNRSSAENICNILEKAYNKMKEIENVSKDTIK